MSLHQVSMSLVWPVRVIARMRPLTSTATRGSRSATTWAHESYEQSPSSSRSEPMPLSVMALTGAVGPTRWCCQRSPQLSMQPIRASGDSGDLVGEPLAASSTAVPVADDDARPEVEGKVDPVRQLPGLPAPVVAVL